MPRPAECQIDATVPFAIIVFARQSGVGRQDMDIEAVRVEMADHQLDVALIDCAEVGLGQGADLAREDASIRGKTY